MSDLPEMRIGDRDRLAVQDRLRDAYGQGALDTDELEERLELALRARTQSDLVPLVADLPAPRETSEVERLTTPAAVRVEADGQNAGDGGRHGVPWGWLLVAFVLLGGLGAGQRFLGGLGDFDAVALFGSRQVALSPEDPEVRILSMFGSVEVIVPEGVRPVNDTTAVFGSSECERACTGDVGGTTVTVSGVALFGSVEFIPSSG